MPLNILTKIMLSARKNRRIICRTECGSVYKKNSAFKKGAISYNYENINKKQICGKTDI